MKKYDNGTIEAFDSDYRQSDAFVLEMVAPLDDIITVGNKFTQTPSLTMGCFYNLGDFKVKFDYEFIKNGLTFVFNVTDGGYPQTIRFEDDADSNNYFEVSNASTSKYLGYILLSLQTTLLNKNITISFSNPTGTRPCIAGIYSGFAGIITDIIDFEVTTEKVDIYDSIPFNSAEFTCLAANTADENFVDENIKNFVYKIFCGSKDLNSISGDYYHYALVGTFWGKEASKTDGNRKVKLISSLEHMDNQKVSIDDAYLFSHVTSRTTEYFLDHFFGNKVNYDDLIDFDNLLLPDADISYLEVLTQICKHNGLSIWEDNETIIHLTNFAPEEKQKEITYNELFAIPQVESNKTTYDIIECNLPKYTTSDLEQIKVSCIIEDTYNDAKIYMDEDGDYYNYNTLEWYKSANDVDWETLFTDNDNQKLSFLFTSNASYDLTSYVTATPTYVSTPEYIYSHFMATGPLNDVLFDNLDFYESSVIIKLSNISANAYLGHAYDVVKACITTITSFLSQLTYAKPFTEKTYKYKRLIQGDATSTNIYKLDLNTAPYLGQYLKTINYISNDFNSKNKAVTLRYIGDLTLDLHDGLYIPYDEDNAVIGHITKNTISYNGGISQTLICNVKDYSPYDCQTFASTTLICDTDLILFTGEE